MWGGAQWRRGGVAGGRRAITSLHFGISENCRKNFVLSENSSKNVKFELKTLILGKFEGKIKILSTHNLLCRKFAAFCRKKWNFLPGLLFWSTTTLVVDSLKTFYRLPANRAIDDTGLLLFYAKLVSLLKIVFGRAAVGYRSYNVP